MNTWRLIEFSSKSCVPCRVMKPRIEKIMEQYPNQVTLYDVDDEAGQEAADHYNVRSVPTFILEDVTGSIRKIHSGSMSEKQLEDFVLN